MNILDGTKKGRDCSNPRSETKSLLKLSPTTGVHRAPCTPRGTDPGGDEQTEGKNGKAGLRGWGWFEQATLSGQIKARRQGSLGRRRGPFTCVRRKQHVAQVEWDVEWTHVFSPTRERGSTCEDSHMKSGSISISFPIVIKGMTQYCKRSRLFSLASKLWVSVKNFTKGTVPAKGSRRPTTPHRRQYDPKANNRTVSSLVELP